MRKSLKNVMFRVERIRYIGPTGCGFVGWIIQIVWGRRAVAADDWNNGLSITRTHAVPARIALKRNLKTAAGTVSRQHLKEGN